MHIKISPIKTDRICNFSNVISGIEIDSSFSNCKSISFEIFLKYDLMEKENFFPFGNEAVGK